jgi:glucan biosynthesis protein C
MLWAQEVEGILGNSFGVSNLLARNKEKENSSMAVQSPAIAKTSAFPAVVTTQAPVRARLLYLDNLRILLTALVILLHLAIGYGAAGDWYYNEEGETSIVSAVLLTLFTAINQAFFMGFFFMISSYLTPCSYDRKGAGVYLVDRLKRLGLPVLFFGLVIQPLLTYALGIYVYGFRGSLGEFILQQGLRAFGVGPLWFVETLLIFSCVYVLWRLLTRSSSTPASTSTSLHAPSNLSIALFALVLGLVTFLVRIAFPVGWWLEPLHLQLAHFPQYVALFALGIIAYRHNWFTELDDSQGRVWRWVATGLVPLFIVIGIAGGALEGDLAAFEGGWHWQALAYSLWEQFMCVAVIVTLLLWFRARFNYQGGLAQALSSASYSVYVVHAPVIVLLALALRPVQLDGGIKFLLVAPLALGLAFLTGYLFKKLPLARDIL